MTMRWITNQGPGHLKITCTSGSVYIVAPGQTVELPSVSMIWHGYGSARYTCDTIEPPLTDNEAGR